MQLDRMKESGETELHFYPFNTFYEGYVGIDPWLFTAIETSRLALLP